MTKKQYPRKGEHGDFTLRCQWCGIPVGPGLLDSLHQHGIFCSYTCLMAGRFYCNLCGLAGYVVFLLAIYFAVPNFQNILFMPGFIIFNLLFGLPLVCLSYGVYLGHKVRRADEMNRIPDYLGLNDMVLSEVCEEVRCYLHENPSDEGIKFRDIADHFEIYGYDDDVIQAALEELLIRNEVRHVGLGMYSANDRPSE